MGAQPQRAVVPVKLSELPSDVLGKVGDALNCRERARLAEVCRELRDATRTEEAWAGVHERQRWVGEDVQEAEALAYLRTLGFVAPTSAHAPGGIAGERKKVFEAIREHRRLLRALNAYTPDFPDAGLRAAAGDDVGLRSFSAKVLAKLHLAKAEKTRFWLQGELKSCLSALGVQVGLAGEDEPAGSAGPAARR